MAVSENPRDHQALWQTPGLPGSTAAAVGFRSPRPDRAPLPGEPDAWGWLDRFDRELADALEDTQYEIDGDVPDWPERYQNDASED